MTHFFSLLIPLIFFLSFGYALFKKVKVYDSFTEGVKGAIPLVVSVFPYIASVTMLSKLLQASGLENYISHFLAPTFDKIGVPEELAPLVLVKPLSGSGALAVLSELLERYGVDSYIARCACVVYGSSETIFYIGAVYFAGLKRKSLPVAILIALFSYLVSIIFGCFLCRIM